MKENTENLVVMVAGLPGSGKTAVSDYLARNGFFKIVMGDVVRRRVLEKGVSISKDTMMMEAKMIRRELGPAGVAILLVDYIRRNNIKPPLVIDGLRSIHEVEVIVKNVPGCHVLVYVHSSPSTRFKRLLARRREGDPSSWDDFLSRDKEEIMFGLPLLAAISNYILINEGPIEKLYMQTKELLEEQVECSGELLLRYL
jgi:dephospho-CoA kinase